MSVMSMTGFGRGEASGAACKAVFEISSINRKQLDVQLNLPRAFACLEDRISALVHDRISRGRIQAQLSVSMLPGARKSSAIMVDEELAGEYLKAIRKAARRFKLQDDLSASVLFSLPQVVRYDENLLDAGKLWPVVEKAVVAGLEALEAMKAREGKALAKDILSRFQGLEKLLGVIRKQAPAVPETYRRNLLRRLEEAGIPGLAADERVIKEIALFADRSDVSEEVTRLDSHLNQGREKLSGKTHAGKAMDFLCQEIFREINTIGSKANDLVILRQVVEFKTELERIREQVQNVE